VTARPAPADLVASRSTLTGEHLAAYVGVYQLASLERTTGLEPATFGFGTPLSGSAELD
jgi:hypothetical protein